MAITAVIKANFDLLRLLIPFDAPGHPIAIFLKFSASPNDALAFRER
jgi:hypothetical protein